MPRGIAVCMIHPGIVSTDMHNDMVGRLMASGFSPPAELMAQMITPDQSAEGVVSVIDNMSLGKTGEFVTNTGATLPW